MKWYIWRLLVLIYLNTSGSMHRRNAALKLHEYNQSDSVTQCKRGLISGVDTTVFKFRVDYSMEAMPELQFYFKKHGQERATPLDVGNISTICGRTDRYKCVFIGDGIVDITLSNTSLEIYSKEKVWGYLLWPEEEVESGYQFMPTITDATNISGTLLINHQKIENHKDCTYNLKESILNIIFTCTASEVKPCMINISTNDSSKTIQRKDVASFSSDKVSQDLIIKIKYALCRVDGNVNTITCHIRRRENQPENKTPKDTIDVGTICGVFSFGIIAIFIVAAIIYSIRRNEYDKVHHLCSENAEVDYRMRQTSLDIDN